MSILAVHAMSASNMELTADVYLTHEWMDMRCNFRPLPGELTQFGDSSHPILRGRGSNPDKGIVNSVKLIK
jgi:hypothetical protein